MPIANRSSHGRHHSATGVTLRQESSSENDKSDFNLRHSGSPHLTQNGSGAHSVSSQHRPNIRKRPHSSRSGVIGHNGSGKSAIINAICIGLGN